MFELLRADRRPSFRLMMAGDYELCSRRESRKPRFSRRGLKSIIIFYYLRSVSATTNHSPILKSSRCTPLSLAQPSRDQSRPNELHPRHPIPQQTRTRKRRLNRSLLARRLPRHGLPLHRRLPLRPLRRRHPDHLLPIRRAHLHQPRPRQGKRKIQRLRLPQV